jgi:hypothetical protein
VKPLRWLICLLRGRHTWTLSQSRPDGENCVECGLRRKRKLKPFEAESPLPERKGRRSRHPEQRPEAAPGAAEEARLADIALGDQRQRLRRPCPAW